MYETFINNGTIVNRKKTLMTMFTLKIKIFKINVLQLNKQETVGDG
jgi:hypothetical protein